MLWDRTRADFRNAQLQAKKNAEMARRKERELLFSSSQAQDQKRPAEKLTQDELELNAAGDVTAALKRTHQLMQAELSRSQFAQQTLGWFPCFLSIGYWLTVLQSNPPLLFPPYPSRILAWTPSYRRLETCWALCFVLRNRIPGTLKQLSMSSLEPLFGFYSVAYYTGHCGGLSGFRSS